MKKLFRSGHPSIPSPLIVQLDSRDAALWVGDYQGSQIDTDKAAQLCRLPWNVVVSESSDKGLLDKLNATEDVSDPLVRRRGLIHIIDTDPAEAILPPRHLAILLLNGQGGQRRTGLSALTRRLTMLQDLRRRSIRQLVVAVPGSFEVPENLGELWADGFRTTVTFVSADPQAGELIRQWQQEFAAPLVDLIELSLTEFGEQLSAEYLRGRDGATVLRVRNERGEFRTLDVTDLDDPERPVLSSYEVIGNAALSPLLPSDLGAPEVDAFFADTSISWRPYAAGMPWERDKLSWDKLRSRLRLLDRRGAEENRIFYVTAESGAGGTTFIRNLAWQAAAEGYPTLVARRGLIPITGLEMTNFLTRLITIDREPAEGARPYEVPCVLVFDQNHWDGRDGDLLSFAREIERSGRRICILMVTGPYVSVGMLAEPKFVALSNLSHRVPFEEALLLGHHLNRFLAPHGTSRTEGEWRAFCSSSSVVDGQGIAAFWIVLSFWLQRQIDLGETVQSRVYRQFKEVVRDRSLKVAILRIAAFSTVRAPLPDTLLPESLSWPLADKLEDIRRDVGALGLLRVHSELDRYWAMAHDLLGRYLLTALFYDTELKLSLGLNEAINPEHLRFIVLKQISALTCLSRASLREVADSFAVSIFKIDPDHGHGSLAPFWREVLKALDEMPKSVRTTSRTFLHHGAISRRRIASDRIMFVMSDEDRVSVLRRAVEDLQAALRLDSPPGGDSDLNLYNSLAHALHDLAEAELAAGLDPKIVSETQLAAQEATRKAYSLNPDNTFVVETYARTLLSEGRTDKQLAVTRALEVLTLAYGLMDRPSSENRRVALSRLAERAFDLLLEAGGAVDVDPDTENGAIAIALASLRSGIGHVEGLQLSNLPTENRKAAAELLRAAPIAGNVQAVKLRYMLTVLDYPMDFDQQLELLQSLQGSGPAFTPQMELEFAVLLFQRDRSHEGEILFRRLRSLWRRGEHFVEVPSRLHWLLDSTRTERRQVRAKVAANTDGRGFARVAEFQNAEVPFRTTEFAQEQLRPNTMLAGYVSFGHKGPLLRALTALWR